MSSASPLHTVMAKPLQTAGATLVVQRKCACGAGAFSLTGECAECSKKRLGLQTKLWVNTPGDVCEQEADRVADQVLAEPAHPEVSSAPPRIQRYTGQATGQANTAPTSVDRVLASSGRPLEPAVRRDMEQRLGHDFSRVRVHSGEVAEQSALDVNAHAYTVGQNIVFGAGRFAPRTHEGRRLIAHELTHVVQQTSGAAGIQRAPATDARWTRDVQAARYRGRLMAKRIRTHTKLSREARAKINSELAYFEGTAKDAYLKEVRPALLAVTEIDMPPAQMRSTTASFTATPEPGHAVSEKDISEGMAAYYASTRQSQLELLAVTQAKFHKDIHNMTAAQIDSQWEAGKEAFVSVASTAGHRLNVEQLFWIWLKHWADREKTGKLKTEAIRKREAAIDLAVFHKKMWRFYEDHERDVLGPEYRSAADDVSMATLMFHHSVAAHEILVAAENAGKELTLKQLSDMVVGHAALWDSVTAVAEAFADSPRVPFRPARSRANRPAQRAPVDEPAPVNQAAPVKQPGPVAPAQTVKASPPPPPARPPAQTIKASPPPPPSRATVGSPRTGGPVPATDVEVIAGNVRDPSSIKPQDPTTHQDTWRRLGGSEAAPDAYHGPDGSIRVSTDHKLLASPSRGVIPPVSPGTKESTSPRHTPPPRPAPAPAKRDIGTVDTGQAPAVSSATLDPLAKTGPAPAPPAAARPSQQPGPRTAPASKESQQGIAPRPRKGARFYPKDPPQAISPDAVKRLGPRARFTVDKDRHQQAWELLGGKGAAPPAFFSEGNGYLDPSRWPPNTK